MPQGENIAQREPLGLSVGSAADQLAGFVHVEIVRVPWGANKGLPPAQQKV